MSNTHRSPQFLRRCRRRRRRPAAVRASGPPRACISPSAVSGPVEAASGAQRYAILREAGTEPPFTSPLLKEHRKGIFHAPAAPAAVLIDDQVREWNGLAELLEAAARRGRRRGPITAC